MKCPRCGKANGKTNKYCRECGIRLPDVEPVDRASATDEVGVGEVLFEVWEMLEAGDFDAALEKAGAMLEEVPDSASAHSLIALIYERKGDRELDQGNQDEARSLFKLAVEQYEKIIDLNPDSTADREKLASIRRKAAGEIEPTPLAPRAVFKAALKAVPKPVLAGFGAFILIVILAIALYPSKDQRVAGAQTQSRRAGSDRAGSAVTPNAPKSPAATESPSALKVYTYRAGQQTGGEIPTRAPKTESVTTKTPKQSGSAKSVKLPSFAGTELAVVPRNKTSTTEKPPKTADAAGEKTQPTAPSPNTGSKMLAEAIKLHDQGYTDEAVGAAQQAIALYQGDVEAGKNVDSAKRGAENAKKLIKVWNQE